MPLLKWTPRKKVPSSDFAPRKIEQPPRFEATRRWRALFGHRQTLRA